MTDRGCSGGSLRASLELPVCIKAARLTSTIHCQPQLAIYSSTPQHDFASTHYPHSAKHPVVKMNALVSQYTKPQFESEALPQDEDQELIPTAHPLSLKFALPPVAQVGISRFPQRRWTSKPS